MLNSKTFCNRRMSKKSGFTLIELSIVLIIIGLLVAGVTGGASLIRSAQLRSVMSEARGYNVAVNAFVVQYDELPGDYTTSLNGSDGGNQNGQVNYVDIVTSGSLAKFEGLIAWHQLINSNTIDDTLSLTSPAAIAISFSAAGNASALAVNTNIPDSKLDGVGWIFDYSTTGGVANNEARNVVIATSNIAAKAFTMTAVTHVTPVGAITATDSLSIDAKLDDGKFNDGRVQASDAVATPANCYNATNYDTTQTSKGCALEFAVDIN